MFNQNKAPKNINNVQNSASHFKIPLQVTKLLRRIGTNYDKDHLEKTIRQFLNIKNQDQVFSEIFEMFSWDEDSQSFQKEVNYSSIRSFLESTYDFSVEEFLKTNNNISSTINPSLSQSSEKILPQPVISNFNINFGNSQSNNYLINYSNSNISNSIHLGTQGNHYN
jgi:hypothetical protein